jgi:hypothetical protein
LTFLLKKFSHVVIAAAEINTFWAVELAFEVDTFG